jgi:hypothetical protein
MVRPSSSLYSDNTECKSRWKLHLRPDYLPKIDGIEIEIPELPPSRTVDDIFADFLEYVKGQLHVHVTSSHGNGESLWNSLYRNMDVVLTTPNGWEGRHQHRMRQAAMAAGLVNRGTQVKFVTEAEVEPLVNFLLIFYCSL